MISILIDFAQFFKTSMSLLTSFPIVDHLGITSSIKFLDIWIKCLFTVASFSHLKKEETNIIKYFVKKNGLKKCSSSHLQTRLEKKFLSSWVPAVFQPISHPVSSYLCFLIFSITSWFPVNIRVRWLGYLRLSI